MRQELQTTNIKLKYMNLYWKLRVQFLYKHICAVTTTLLRILLTKECVRELANESFDLQALIDLFTNAIIYTDISPL